MVKLITRNKKSKPYLGFTLVEMAVVLIILALIVGGMIIPLSAQIDIQRYNETENTLAEVKEALLGYVVANKRLPCPDSDGDGLENLLAPILVNGPVQSTQTFACAVNEGQLPYQVLGVGRMDTWSNRFLYRVAPAFSSRTVVWSANNATGNVISDTYFNLSSSGDISIQTRGDNPGTPAVEAKYLFNIATGVPAVIVSYGKNGYGAIGSNGVAMPAPPAANVDETTNATIGTTKISRLLHAPGACSDTVEGSAPCEFDDAVTWLSANVIMNRMVTSGQLP